MKSRPKAVWKITLIFLSTFLVHPIVKGQEQVVPDSISQTNTSGIENLLQGRIAGLLVKSWTGTAGSQSTINLRGLALNSTDALTTPLFLINGVPIISNPSGVTGINPLSYYSAEQIERIEIWKDIDQLAAWGIQAPNGAINIIIKEGAKGPLHVKVKVAAGIDYLKGMNEEKDRFYHFDPSARKAVYANQSIIHEQHASIDGGGDFGSYLFGMNNYMASGAINDAQFQRQNLFVNAKYKIAEPFTVQFYSNLALAKRAGRFAGQYQRDLSNSLVKDEEFFLDDNKNVGLISSMDFVYRFSEKWRLRSLAGLSYETAGRDLYIPSTLLDGNVTAGSETIKRQLLSLNTSLQYLHDFSDDFHLDMTLGHQIVNADYRNTGVHGTKPLASGGSDYVKVVTGYNANQTHAFSDFDQDKLLSFYGQFNWNYQDRLLVNMVARADGSSLYQKKWGFYPAISLAYDLKEEFGFPFRLKTGYGRTGQRMGPEHYRGELTSLGDYYAGNKLGIAALYEPFTGAKSVDIRQFDAKIATTLMDRFQVQLGYFQKSYSDFTYSRQFPNIQGSKFQFETGAGLSLQGLEIEAQLPWILKDNLTWRSDFNLAAFQDKVTSWPDQLENTSLSHLAAIRVNDPINSIIAYEAGQRKVIGHSQPKWFGGLSNDLQFGQFGLGILLTYSLGSEAALASYSSQYTAERLGASFPMNSAETPYYLVDELTAGMKSFRGISEVQSTDFIRLSRISLAYNLGDYINNWNIKQATISLRGENLYSLSKYKGSNPEENITGIRRADLMYTGTILPASIVLGLKLTF